jgi:hypothetical protein
MIDATQWSCIPQEILNNNTRNIAFSMNRHNTFIWPRHASREHFHTPMLPFYLDEDALDKEVMSWPGVKRGQRKSGMHYIFPAELLKKKDKEAGEGPSSGPETKKLDALTDTDSEEEEETLQLERRKRPPPPRQLPANVVLSGAQVNQMLGTMLATEPMGKRPRTGVSPNKPLNPQPLTSVAPQTHAMTKATTIIDIQDDPDPETILPTLIIEQPPPLQLPNLLTTIPHQTTASESMQLDHPKTKE